MSKDAIFSCEDFLVARHCSNVIYVAIHSCDALKIVDLGDALLATDSLLQSLGVAKRWCVLVRLERKDVMSNRVSVADSSDLGRLRRPVIRRHCVLLVLGLLNHAIKQALEGSFLRRRLRADVIGGASREGLRVQANRISIEACVLAQSQLESVLRGAVGNFATGDSREVFIEGNCASLPVHIEEGVAAGEILIDFVRIDTSVALFGVHKALEGAHRLRL